MTRLQSLFTVLLGQLCDSPFPSKKSDLQRLFPDPSRIPGPNRLAAFHSPASMGIAITPS
jgi:hypothetical protein